MILTSKLFGLKSHKTGNSVQSPASVRTAVCSGVMVPSGNHIHSLQHLEALLKLLLTTLNVPKCALMTRSIQNLPPEWVYLWTADMTAAWTGNQPEKPVRK